MLGSGETVVLPTEEIRTSRNGLTESVVRAPFVRLAIEEEDGEAEHSNRTRK